jgi:broad specificity phosphatase PhoE
LQQTNDNINSSIKVIHLFQNVKFKEIIMNLIFVRHGQSEANVERVMSNRGWVHPLTVTGKEQAYDLAARLQSAGASKIFTSPLRRAVETAQILAKTLHVPLEVTDALCEYDCGVLEGKADAESWRLHMQVKHSWLLDCEFENRIEGGESYQDIKARFLPFITVLSDSFSEDETVILVGHGGTYQCMLPALCINLDMDAGLKYPFPNTGFVRVRKEPHGFVCVEWCGEAIEVSG